MADELAERRKRHAAIATTASLGSLRDSFLFSLQSRDLSPRTIKVYERTMSQFATHLGGGDAVGGITAEQVRGFLAAETARTSAVSAHQHYRNLKVLFKWLVREGELERSPMERVDAPRTTVKIKPVIRGDDLSLLLKVCDGNSFEQRRDAAILSILIDTGVRVAGVAGMKTSDVALARGEIRVTLKGGDEHVVSIARKATAALDRYVRARARHKNAASDWLWLGLQGQRTAHFNVSGIQSMIRRRCQLAGIEVVTPHAFRRTFAHDMLDGGASIEDVMQLAGWKTPDMVMRYAGELAGERARKTHARISPRDRFQ